MDTLRKPLFFVAVALLLLAVLVELGSTALLQPASSAAAARLDAPTPGRGIPTLALVDALVLYTVILMGLALIVPERVHGRVQGIASLIVSLLVLLAAVASMMVGIALLVLMLTLLLSPIFGTIAYFAIYGDFDREGATVALSLVMLLKLGFAGCLVFAQQRFLQNKGLVLIVLTSLVAMLLLSWLHGFVPGFLVSITDTLAAIVNGVLAAIWAIVMLVGAVVAIVKAIV